MNPTVLIVVGLVLISTFVAGVLWEKERFDEFRGGVEAIGKAQEKWSQQRNAELNAAKKGVEDAHKKELSARDARHKLELARLPRLDTRGSVVPGAGEGPVDTVLVKCYDAARLDESLRGTVQTFLVGAAKLLQSSGDSANDSTFWGKWARQINACPAVN